MLFEMVKETANRLSSILDTIYLAHYVVNMTQEQKKIYPASLYAPCYVVLTTLAESIALGADMR